MSGFGFGFGSVPFGGAWLFGSIPFIAVQLSANLLALPPGLGSTAFQRDAWDVVPLDPGGRDRLVQSVDVVTEENQGRFGLPQLVLTTLPATLLTLDGVLTYGKRYRVTFGGASYDFTALRVAASAAPPDVRTDGAYIIDLANPYLERDALVFPPQLSTYQVTDAGDLGADKSGEASLRKRLVRRVLSSSGEFFHLIGYGAGVLREVNRLVSVDMLRRLSSRIRAQALQEPEVQGARCELRQLVPGVVQCILTVSTYVGEVQVVVPIQLP